MKVFLPLFILVFLTSCAAKYGIVAGAQMPKYEEDVTIIDLFGGSDTDLEPYTTDGTGFHIGISEETDWLLTKISYYQNTYSNESYKLESSTIKTDLKESGVMGTTGFKLWWFQPLFGFKYVSREYSNPQAPSDTNYILWTLGMDIEVPMSKRFYVYGGYHYSSGSDLDITHDTEFTVKTMVLGLRYNFSE
ncbi:MULTISPECIES: hypothetical protein [Halobacteriovorax]|uniref:Outer membrane protein beta-barrel domain-containing protein n=1 Tax=Halobacteriovorax vibrionivorans TaxID=2152716 RepID=A0ABY0IJI9_9BACT|nr:MULTISPECIES: hypothetical protein [Halobacteriovorax]AYF45759.1 putative lipoprotein [Halobacteriovorax sp. BALOs_7]RZF22797.1 hypothetical protein DAY19_03220 [Halobacteriovorax vibrionivorans]TGD45988.1 hypothetical protein EP118_13910 [Halobacteriovorax sp. Y22]